MQLQVRDWVRTTEYKFGRVASVNDTAMTANIQALDDTGQSIVVLTFPLSRLVKIDETKYLPKGTDPKAISRVPAFGRESAT